MYTHTHTHTHIYIYIFIREVAHTRNESFYRMIRVFQIVHSLSHSRTIDGVLGFSPRSLFPRILPSNLSAYLSPPPAHLLTGSICKSIYLFHIYIYICIYVSLSIDRFIHLLCLNVVPRCTRSHTLA